MAAEDHPTIPPAGTWVRGRSLPRPAFRGGMTPQAPEWQGAWHLSTGAARRYTRPDLPSYSRLDLIARCGTPISLEVVDHQGHRVWDAVTLTERPDASACRRCLRYVARSPEDEARRVVPRTGGHIASASNRPPTGPGTRPRRGRCGWAKRAAADRPREASGIDTRSTAAPRRWARSRPSGPSALSFRSSLPGPDTTHGQARRAGCGSRMRR